MIRKVEALNETFVAECAGEIDVAAQLLSNFLSQRLIRPLVYREIRTPLERLL